ncbi:unnamed protein product [Sphagnum troendelagicum]
MRAGNACSIVHCGVVSSAAVGSASPSKLWSWNSEFELRSRREIKIDDRDVGLCLVSDFSIPLSRGSNLTPSAPETILLVAASRTLFPLVPAVAKTSALIPALTSPSARVGHSLDSVVLSEYWLYHNYLPLLTLPASPPPSEERHSLTSSARTPDQHLPRHRHGNSCDHSRHCIQNCSRSRLGTQSNQLYATVEGHHHPEVSAIANDDPRTPSDHSPPPDSSQAVPGTTPPPIAETPITLSLTPDYPQVADAAWAPILSVSAATPTPGADEASAPILVVPGPIPAEAPRTLSTPSSVPGTINSGISTSSLQNYFCSAVFPGTR